MKNNGSRSWVKIMTGVLLIVLIGILLIAGFIGLGAGACSYVWAKDQRHFDTVQIGDTKDTVITKMGNPSHIEKPDILFGRYADKKCQGACVERFWYEQRMCLDLRAWALELDKNQKVINKFSATSP